MILKVRPRGWSIMGWIGRMLQTERTAYVKVQSLRGGGECSTRDTGRSSGWQEHRGRAIREGKVARQAGGLKGALGGLDRHRMTSDIILNSWKPLEGFQWGNDMGRFLFSKMIALITLGNVMGRRQGQRQGVLQEDYHGTWGKRRWWLG